jgi:hypothetical protein
MPLKMTYPKFSASNMMAAGVLHEGQYGRQLFMHCTNECDARQKLT